MGYNLSPDMSIEIIFRDDVEDENIKEYIEYLKEKGYIIHNIDFTGHVDDDKSKQNGAPVRVRGITIRHCNRRFVEDKIDERCFCKI